MPTANKTLCDVMAENLGKEIDVTIELAMIEHAKDFAKWVLKNTFEASTIDELYNKFINETSTDIQI